MFVGFWSWVLVIIIVAAIFYANKLPQLRQQAGVLFEKSKKELEAKAAVLAEKAKEKQQAVKAKSAPIETVVEEKTEITSEDLEFMPKETKKEKKSAKDEKSE